MNQSLLFFLFVTWLCLFYESHGWKSKSLIMKDDSSKTFLFPFTYQDIPKIDRTRSIYSIDIRCGKGQSSHFLHQILHKMYDRSPIHIVGLDTVSMNLYDASLTYPHIPFLELDLFRKGRCCIPPQRLDVIQISLSSLQFYTIEKVTTIEALLRPNGCLHLYGSSIPSEFKWEDVGLKCIARIPFIDPDMEYVILQQTNISSQGFLIGIPSLIISIYGSKYKN